MAASLWVATNFGTPPARRVLGRAPWRRVQQAIHRAGICAGFLAQAHPVPVVPGAIDHLDYRHIKHVRQRRTAPRQAGRQVTTASQHESRHDFSKAHVCQTLYACAQVLARGRGARAFGRGSCPNQCRARISRFSPAASRDLSSRRAARHFPRRSAWRRRRWCTAR